MSYFHVISWCGNFVERQETMRKLYLSTKFPHQKIRCNHGILRGVDTFRKPHRTEVNIYQMISDS